MQIEENDVIIDLIASDEITFARRRTTDAQVQIGWRAILFFEENQEEIQFVENRATISVWGHMWPGKRKTANGRFTGIGFSWRVRSDDCMKLQVSRPLISLYQKRRITLRKASNRIAISGTISAIDLAALHR